MKKKIAAAGYLTLFRDIYRSARSESVTYVSVISKVIKQYFDIKLSKSLLHPNPLWNSADILHLM